MSRGLLRQGMVLSGVALLALGLVLWGPAVFSKGSSAAQPPAADDNPFAVPAKPDAAPKKLDKPRPLPADDNPFATGRTVKKEPGVKPEAKGASAPGGATPSPAPKPPRKPNVPFTGGEAAIEKALASPTEADFDKTPLQDVIDYFADQHHIPIVLDRRAMAQMGIDPSTVHITYSSRARLSLRSVLDLMLRPRDLTWTIRSEVLLITTPDVAEYLVFTRVYEVADLLSRRDQKDVPEEDYENLLEAIEQTIARDTWDECGGPGAIMAGTFGNARVLIVSEAYDMQAKVAGVIEGLRKIAAKPGSDNSLAAGPAIEKKPDARPEAKRSPAPGGPSAPPPPAPIQESTVPSTGGEAPIEKALASPTEAGFEGTPLPDVLAFFANTHHIPIVVDRKAMENGGLDPSTMHVSFSCPARLSFRSVLDLVLRQHDLTWTVRSEVLLITTPEAARDMLITKVYDMADLVRCRDEKDVPWDDYDTLIAAVETIAPSSWSDSHRGDGAIMGRTVGDARVLIVTQTYDVHAEIARLLEEIRKIGAKSGGDQKPPDAAQTETRCQGCVRTVSRSLSGNQGGYM